MCTGAVVRTKWKNHAAGLAILRKSEYPPGRNKNTYQSQPQQTHNETNNLHTFVLGPCGLRHCTCIWELAAIGYLCICTHVTKN